MENCFRNFRSVRKSFEDFWGLSIRIDKEIEHTWVRRPAKHCYMSLSLPEFDLISLALFSYKEKLYKQDDVKKHILEHFWQWIFFYFLNFAKLLRGNKS